MDGARACGGGGDVWRLSHSTRATSDVLCGAVVANSTSGGAAGGAGGVASATVGVILVAGTAGSPQKDTRWSVATAGCPIYSAADKKAAARLRKGSTRGGEHGRGGQTHQSLLQFETISLQMGPAEAETPSWTVGLK